MEAPQQQEAELTGYERCASGLAEAVKSLNSRQNRDSAQAALESSVEMVGEGSQLLLQA